MTKHNKLATKRHLDAINPIYIQFSFILRSATWGLKFTVPWTSPCDCEVRRWRKLVRGGEKVTLTHTHTQAGAVKGELRFVSFFFNLYHFVLWRFCCHYLAVFLWRESTALLLGALLSLVSVHAALPSRGAILTVGVAVNQLKLAAPLY